MLQLISLLTMTLAFAAPIQKRLQATTAISNDCEIVINAWNQMKPTDKWNTADGTPDGCCSYGKGVICDWYGRVTVIDWRWSKLSGQIPQELRNLKNLNELYFKLLKVNFIGLCMEINCLVKCLFPHLG